MKLMFFSAFHPQADNQIEVTNKSLENLLRCLVADHVTSWDIVLPQVEFALKAGPFKVFKKLDTNVYIIDLPSDFGISQIFNIEYLIEFKSDENYFSTLPAPEASQTPTLRVPTNTATRDEIASILEHQFVTTRR
ncbi:hypothetical protein I3760_15G108500 [Carya illinoinensis]|nr:hypothetical protein I3760_15G108500 [Carya illinoinensis]